MKKRMMMIMMIMMMMMMRRRRTRHNLPGKDLINLRMYGREGRDEEERREITEEEKKLS